MAGLHKTTNSATFDSGASCRRARRRPNLDRTLDNEMHQNSGLTLTIRRDSTKYAWSLYRDGISEPIKCSVPIFSTEAAATAAGMEVLARVNMRKK